MFRRIIHGILILALFIGYYIITDPDLGLVNSLPYGADLILAMNFIVIYILGVIAIEISLRLWVTSKEPSPLEESAKKQQSSGEVYIGHSIRILAYAIIIAASIVAIFK